MSISAAALFEGCCSRAMEGLLSASCSFGVCAELHQSSRLVRLPVVDGKDIHFSHVFSGNGPAHSRAHRIVQGEQGFLWFATADKLQRYDGYRQ